MIKTNLLIEKIQHELNQMSDNVLFKLYDGTGDFFAGVENSEQTVINGVAIPQPGTIIPVEGLNNYYMTLSLSLIAAVEQIDEVRDILQRYIQDTAGTGFEIGEYIAVVNFDMLSVGDADIRSMIGKSVTLHTNIYYQIIKNGVLSNNCNIFVDGEKLIALEFAIARARIAQTSNVENSEEMQSVIGQQGLTIDVTFPYLKRVKAMELVSDIIAGKLYKTYTVLYDDGIVNAGGTPPAWKAVLSDGSVSFQAGKVPVIRAKFYISRL